jgi:hypothetical protein
MIELLSERQNKRKEDVCISEAKLKLIHVSFPDSDPILSSLLDSEI